MEVKVSIIIPMYNVKKYLDRCLNSVINSKLREIEIILVNDESPDNCGKMADKYAKIDSRIKVIHKKNAGLGLARNSGLEIATGEFVAFLDSDDFVDEDFYYELYKSAKDNNTDVVFANHKRYYNKDIFYINDEVNKYNKIESAKNILYDILMVRREDGKIYQTSASACKGIYKREILLKNKIKFYSEREFISEDLLFNIDFLSNAKTVSFSLKSYYYYCYNATSLTQTYKKDRFEKNKILSQKIVEITKKYGIFKEAKEGISNLFIGNVVACIKQEVNNNNFKFQIKNIKEIIEDEYVKNVVQNKIKPENFSKKILICCMRKKYIFLIWTMAKIKNLFKK